MGLLLVTRLTPTGRIPPQTKPWTSIERGLLAGPMKSVVEICFLIGSSASVAFGVLSLRIPSRHICPFRRKRSPRRSPASRELALRVRSDFWVSLDPAPPLLWTTESRIVGSVCDSRANYFLNLSTYTIVYLPSRVHNWDIPASAMPFLQRDVVDFLPCDVATGVSVYCAAAAVRTRLLIQKPRHRCRGFAFR